MLVPQRLQNCVPCARKFWRVAVEQRQAERKVMGNLTLEIYQAMEEM